MGALFVVLVLLFASPGLAVGAIATDGDTLTLGATTVRFDGIDAPEIDQVCLDERGDSWACGVEARDQLVKLIGGRLVHCEDKGPDTV
jgi:endonuclease YncB( thermonuclease family)